VKSLRNYLLGLLALLLVLALLVWFLPARWARPWIEPQLHGLQLQQVHGTLWDGRSDQVMSAGGEPLGKLRWTLSRRALLGDARTQLFFDGPFLAFSGAAHRLAEQRVELHDLALTANLDKLSLPAASPLGRPGGELVVDASHALLQGGWPLELQLHAQWRQARMHTADGDVALGTLALQAQSHAGVIQARLHDVGGGPLAAKGELQLSPLGWRLDATLSSRQTDPLLEHWLAKLGTPSADGSVHVQRRGGLAGTLPAPLAEKDPAQP
jgi:general secretion pathway protein N